MLWGQSEFSCFSVCHSDPLERGHGTLAALTALSRLVASSEANVFWTSFLCRPYNDLVREDACWNLLAFCLLKSHIIPYRRKLIFRTCVCYCVCVVDSVHTATENVPCDFKTPRGLLLHM